MGTIATINAANPESMCCSEIVTPPLPASNKQAPMINDVRQFAQVDLLMPCAHAITYMIRPAATNRAPAIRNGGIDSKAHRIPKEWEPHIRKNGTTAMNTRPPSGAALQAWASPHREREQTGGLVVEA